MRPADVSMNALPSIGFANAKRGRKRSFVGLPVSKGDCLCVKLLRRPQKLAMRGLGMPCGQARLGLSLKLFRGRSPCGIPAIGIAILDAGNGREDLPDIHDSLRGIANHRSCDKVKTGVFEKAANPNGVGCRGLRCRISHPFVSLS